MTILIGTTRRGGAIDKIADSAISLPNFHQIAELVRRHRLGRGENNVVLVSRYLRSHAGMLHGCRSWGTDAPISTSLARRGGALLRPDRLHCRHQPGGDRHSRATAAS